MLALVIVLACWAVLTAVGAAPALAYSAPSAAGSNSSVCPPRPADDNGESGGGVDDAYLAQELADDCQLTVQDQAGLMMALSKLDGDVSRLDSDVKAGSSQAHSDAQAEQSSAQTSTAASTDTNTVAVSNFPADQTVGLDAASSGQVDNDDHALSQDLWMVLGTIVGCFVFAQILGRLWP